MTHTQPEALRLAHTLSGGKLIDDSTEWADTLHAAAAELRHQHTRIEELEAQLSATIAAQAKQGLEAGLAAAAQEGWCDGCNPDNCCGCGPAAPAKVQPIEGVPVVPQEVNASNEWEDIRTLPTCDDLIWLYCQDSNTIDGPIAPEPNLEEYGWSHWAYANAPSTAWIDATQAKQGE